MQEYKDEKMKLNKISSKNPNTGKAILIKAVLLLLCVAFIIVAGVFVGKFARNSHNEKMRIERKVSRLQDMINELEIIEESDVTITETDNKTSVEVGVKVAQGEELLPEHEIQVKKQVKSFFNNSEENDISVHLSQ